MITVRLDEIRSTVVALLAESFRQIEANGLTEVTSFGVWFDAYQGAVGVSLNDNDDDSYRCETLSSYTRKNWRGVGLEPLKNFEQDHYNLPEGSDSIEIVANGVSHTHAELQDYFEHFFREGVGWVREFFESLPAGGWRPVWIQIEESNSHSVECLKCADGPPPPPSGDWTREPLKIRGFTPPTRGFKIYKLGFRNEKYASIHLDQDVRLKLDGTSKKAEFGQPFPVKCFDHMLRLGGLADCFGTKTFALSAAAPQFREAKQFLESWVELLPVSSGDRVWQLVHALHPISVLNQAATEFEKMGERIYAIKVAEFEVAQLRQFARPIFQIADAPTGTPYFLETEESESFPQFCQRIGLRGIDFDLVWCEDLNEITAELDEFMRIVQNRLARMHPDAEVAKWMNIECLSGLQCNIWRIGTFRKLLKEEGVVAAVANVQGLGELKIPCIKHLLPRSWNYSNSESVEQIIPQLEPILQEREILEEMRGYFCTFLPRALNALQEMEGTNSGRLAVYGPTI
ncbi:MAG TPA: hypothetical protein VL282_00210 [Tepidisphaeraceae bacterium]|jgi:hypothetical protein|nr:hypothetical protein [Tepidisphaeraceae bacterium]